MGIDTKIILITYIATEILTKEGFSVMAALICILGGLPKDDRVTSFRFSNNSPQRYRNSKKHCTDGIARFSIPATGLWAVLFIVCNEYAHLWEFRTSSLNLKR